jgi:hypothetical protein
VYVAPTTVKETGLRIPLVCKQCDRACREIAKKLAEEIF